MIRTCAFVRPCPACPDVLDMGLCPDVSGVSGGSTSALFSKGNALFEFMSGQCPDNRTRRHVGRTRWGNGNPPLGGVPSLPRHTPKIALSVRGGRLEGQR